MRYQPLDPTHMESENDGLDYLRKALYPKPITKDELPGANFQVNNIKSSPPTPASARSNLTIQGTDDPLNTGGVHPIVIDEIKSSFDEAWEEEVLGEVDNTFRLWKFQQKLVDDFERYNHHIITKARQVGISTLMIWFMLNRRKGWYVVNREDTKRYFQPIINKMAQENHVADTRKRVRLMNPRELVHGLRMWNSGKIEIPEVIYCDEYCSWDDKIKEELHPHLRSTWQSGDTRLVVSSSYDPEDKHFKDMMSGAIKGTSGAVHHRVSIEEAPEMEESFLEHAKNTMTSDQFLVQMLLKEV